MPPSDLAYTIQEAAEKLRVSPKLVRDLIDRGELRRVKLGDRVIIPAVELERILNTKEQR